MLTTLIATGIVSPGTDFRTIFPAFADVADDLVDYWTTRAARTVDDSWPEADRDHATMLLTAHLMTQQGLGTGADSEAFAAGLTGFRRVRTGALELERFVKDDTSDFDSTSYGRQFAKLLRAVKGGPRVTSTGSIPCCGPGPSW